MTLTTITISGNEYVANASVAEADAHLAVDPTRGTAWTALSTDAKGAHLVAATRRLNLLRWQGSKALGALQADAFPRTGLTYADGTAVPTDVAPDAVAHATALLAGSIELDNEAGSSGSSGTNVKRVKAGSAEVEFFRQQTGVPLQDETAYELVREFLASWASGIGAGEAYGTDGASAFDDGDAWGRTEGFP